MKLFYFAVLCFFMVAAVSCKNNTQAHQHGDATDASTFVCPMKCEGDKVYAEGGKCPVCGMDLVPGEASAAAATYTMQLATTPTQVASGQAVKLSFTPKLTSNASTLVPLDEVHEKKLHVIVVSSDLGWYDHIHPEYQSDGSYTLDFNFPHGGDYIIFADYKPSGSTPQVERLTLSVSGQPKKAEAFTAEQLKTSTDGYAVALVPVEGKFVTNNLNHLGVDVTKNGKPVTDFEPVMGALGHLVIISGDGKEYLHVHPEEVAGKLDLHVQFEKAGIYRAYFQFQTAGTLHTSYFTLDVKEGKAGDIKTDHNDDGEMHSHDGGEPHKH